MDMSMKESLSAAYEADLMEAIAQARMGLLSPSQQEYCFDEIGNAKESQGYPGRGDALLAELRAILEHKPQITDREQAEREYAEKHIELLFFVSLDRYTFAEITHLKDTDEYDGRIYINGSRHKEDIDECAAVMKKSFDEWLEHSSIEVDQSKTAAISPDPCDGRFKTLQEAIALVHKGLINPKSLL